jgi:hypothetical protein
VITRRAKFQGKLRNAAGWMFGRTFTKELIVMPLDGQVKVIRRWMTFPGVTMPNVRGNLVEGLPKDIREKINAGESQEAIKSYYWECLPFRQLWVDMQLNEETLDKLIKEAFLDYVTKP